MGSQISIMNDAWISSSPNYKLSTDLAYLHILKVLDLIEVNIKAWKKEMITNTFLMTDARGNFAYSFS